MVNNIGLQDYSNLFVEKEIVDVKPINFIFGKNGTGKSTIADIIKNKIDSDTVEVRIFNGFDGIVDNENLTLNAFTLGEKNNEIQRQIDALVNQQKELNNSLFITNEVYSNADSALRKIRKEYQSSLWNKVYTPLHNAFPDALQGYGGSKENFSSKVDTLLGKYQPVEDLMTITELKKLETEVKQGKKIAQYESFDEIALVNINAILSETVKTTAKGVLAATIKNHGLEHWITEGQPYFKNGGSCPFCGREVSEIEFDEIVGQFAEVIDNSYDLLQEKVVNALYSFREQCEEVELKFTNIQAHSNNLEKEYLVDVSKEKLTLDQIEKEVENLLIKKQTNLTEELEIGELEVNLGEVIESVNLKLKKVNTLIDNHNALINDSENQLIKLNNHVINLICDQSSSDLFEKIREDYNDCLKQQQSAYVNNNVARNSVESNKKEIVELQKLTQNEELAAQTINSMLRRLGKDTISLVKVEGETGAQYKIMGSDSKIRNVTMLSTGEKNVIAFLYFMYKLNEVTDSDKPKIMIFDDPMTSNDDQSVYLILNELEQLINSVIESNERHQLFILTHNTGFYLRVSKLFGKKSKYKKMGYFHLESDGKKTHVRRILDGDKDLKSSYDALWLEAKFCYDNGRINALGNQLRRIFETYYTFNNLGKNARSVIDKLDEEYKLIGYCFVDVLNANSHQAELDEVEMDWKSLGNEKQILKTFKQIMSGLGGEEHFEAHWMQFAEDE